MASPNESVAANETREIPALSLRASFKPDTIDVEKRTAELVFTTGARVRRGGFWTEPFDEELSLDPAHVRMERLTSGRAPLLDSHDGYSLRGQIGVIESASLDKKSGVVKVRFSKRAEVEPIFQDVVDGIIRNVSVGYKVHKFERVQEGDAQKKDNVPVMRAVDWTPYEVSLVPMPADAGAGVRSAHPSLPLGEPSSNPCLFITRSQEPTTMDPIKPETTVTPAPATPTTPAPVSLDAAREAKLREEATAEERTRATEIRSLAKSVKLGDEFAEKLVKDGVKLDAARAAILSELATRDGEIRTEQHVRVEITDDSRDKFLRGASAWLFEKAGNGVVRKAVEMKARGFESLELNGGEFRGMKILDLARMCVERNGGSLRGIYSGEEIIKRALMQRSGGAATSDFAVLFENVMFKQMRANYEIQASTWRRWMGTDTVSNFLTHNRFLNGSFGTLPVVKENAEYKNLGIPDGAKNSISTETRGAVIALSRQAMINDDMGALSDVAVRFGATAGRTIESEAYLLLAQNSGLGPTMSDAQPFFHSNRANVSTSAALSVAAIDADKVKMRGQLDPSSNDYLDLMPAILLVPVGLESAAKVINASAFDHDGTKLQKPNPVQGLFQDIVSSPRLTASTTRRYLFTANKEAFKAVFLEGSGEGPVMEQHEEFRVDGISWKARIDVKVNAYDPKTAITNAGT